MENLLTAYAELYYRVVFYEKNSVRIAEKYYLTDSNTLRKNDTDTNSL